MPFFTLNIVCLDTWSLLLLQFHCDAIEIMQTIDDDGVAMPLEFDAFVGESLLYRQRTCVGMSGQ